MKKQIILSPALDIYLQIKGLKTSFLERTSIYNGTSPFEPTYLSCVGLAFLWGDTPEGYDYWNEISEEFEHTVILDVDQLYIQDTYIIVTTEEQLNDCLKFFILLNRTWNNGESYNSESMLTILLSSLRDHSSFYIYYSS